MGKKKRFIDKKTAETFHVVHRSQRDPNIDDPASSKFVLVSAKDGAFRGDSLAKSGGYYANQSAAPSSTMGKALSTIDPRGFDADGYDYSQHLRPMGE
jgi:protein LTV1